MSIISDSSRRKYERSLAKSYDDFADKLLAGRGFWDGRVIVNDPNRCKAKRDQCRAKAAMYRASYS